jgi:hypothetical protein
MSAVPQLRGGPVVHLLYAAACYSVGNDFDPCVVFLSDRTGWNPFPLAARLAAAGDEWVDEKCAKLRFVSSRFH